MRLPILPPPRAARLAIGLALFLMPAQVRAAAPGDDEPPTKPAGPSPAKAASSALDMAPAIACRSIDGYEDYEPLPDASQTSEEKLLVYYRPLHFKLERKGAAYHGHFTQDAQIRRSGEKQVLQRKEKILEYDFKTDQPQPQVYLRNTISLKGLKPGEYDLEIILHDELAERATATQTLHFRIVPVVLPKGEGTADTPEESPPPPVKAKAKAKRARPKAFRIHP